MEAVLGFIWNLLYVTAHIESMRMLWVAKTIQRPVISDCHRLRPHLCLCGPASIVFMEHKQKKTENIDTQIIQS